MPQNVLGQNQSVNQKNGLQLVWRRMSLCLQGTYTGTALLDDAVSLFMCRCTPEKPHGMLVTSVPWL